MLRPIFTNCDLLRDMHDKHPQKSCSMDTLRSKQMGHYGAHSYSHAYRVVLEWQASYTHKNVRTTFAILKHTSVKCGILCNITKKVLRDLHMERRLLSQGLPCMHTTPINSPLLLQRQRRWRSNYDLACPMQSRHWLKTVFPQRIRSLLCLLCQYLLLRFECCLRWCTGWRPLLAAGPQLPTNHHR